MGCHSQEQISRLWPLFGFLLAEKNWLKLAT